MKIKAIFFDLDGTLLPMNQDEFISNYFKMLTKKLSEHGYEPTEFSRAMWQSITDMITNDGTKTNEEVFWNRMKSYYGEKIIDDKYIFESFYENNFDALRVCTSRDGGAKRVIDLIKKKGARLVLATNPVFPRIATHKRIGWAGLNKDDFEIITTYENSSFCKPNTHYFLDLLERMNLKPEECIMVGNDTSDDTPARTIGMKVFLLTQCLINTKNIDINDYPHGSFDDLCDFINKEL